MRTRQPCPLFMLLFNNAIKILAYAIRWQILISGTKTVKEEAKLSLFAGNMNRIQGNSQRMNDKANSNKESNRYLGIILINKST